MAHSSVLPKPYRLFFTVMEPALTVGGVVYSVLTPRQYLQDLVPKAVAGTRMREVIKESQSAVMAVRQLGSCFFLLALLASIHFRSICTQFDPNSSVDAITNLKDDRRRQTTEQDQVRKQQKFETVVESYLFCLALADLTHIGFTLYDLGSLFAFNPSSWTTLVWGNVGITTGLFVVRSMWFAKVGRKTFRHKARTE
ncbi:hypothetical protein ACM66B_004447 [Microbotryomycetes sp. NB124-2]